MSGSPTPTKTPVGPEAELPVVARRIRLTDTVTTDPFVRASANLQELCDRSTALAAIEALQADLENERMRLAACGVAAMSNTLESAALQRLPTDNPYRSGSYEEVVKAVDREMALRSENERLKAQAQPAEAVPIGFRVSHSAPWAALTDEANEMSRFTVERTEAPFEGKNRIRQWRGPTLQAAMSAALSDLGMPLAATSTPPQPALSDAVLNAACMRHTQALQAGLTSRMAMRRALDAALATRARAASAVPEVNWCSYCGDHFRETKPARTQWKATLASTSDHPFLENDRGEAFHLVGASPSRAAQIAAMLSRRADAALPAPSAAKVEAPTDLDTLRARCEAAEKDTQRLNWLLPNLHPANFGADFDWDTDEEFLAGWRHEIDAALAKASPTPPSGMTEGDER